MDSCRRRYRQMFAARCWAAPARMWVVVCVLGGRFFWSFCRVSGGVSVNLRWPICVPGVSEGVRLSAVDLDLSHATIVD